SVEFCSWNLLELTLFRIVVEIAAEHDRTCLRQFQKQHLMCRRMSRRSLQDNSPVSEDVIVILCHHHYLAVLESAVISRLGSRRRRIGEHDVAFRLSGEPG